MSVKVKIPARMRRNTPNTRIGSTETSMQLKKAKMRSDSFDWAYAPLCGIYRRPDCRLSNSGGSEGIGRAWAYVSP
jgi:hypothetical protein